MIYEPLNVRRLTEEGSDQKQPPQNLKKNNTFLGLFAFNACKEFFDPLKKVIVVVKLWFYLLLKRML